MSANRITVQVICGGDSRVIRALGIPLAESLKADGVEFREQGDAPEFLQASGRPMAGAGAVAAVFGVLVFLGSWGAKKLLDELYATKIRPKIDEVVRSTEAQALKSGRGKKWLFQLGVWYEEERVLILLTLVGDNLRAVMAQEPLLPQLHALALTWLRENRSAAPVHLYIAECGRANLEPLLFERASEAQGYLEGLWPNIVPTDGTPLAP
jgi:hypothetical protein